MTKARLLIVDDDEDIRTQMKWALFNDYELLMAGDRAGAIAAYTADRPTATLLDLGLPPRPNDPEEGMAVLSSILALDPVAKVIVVSGQGDKQNALRAVGAGAYDFLCKPVDMDELGLVLQRCVYLAELEREYRATQYSERADVFEDMLGASPPMQAVFDFIRKVAPTSAPALILGESGTGKEMVAKALHRRSMQRDGPFVAINCNSIPENLLESELFGHEKGAFTGADRQRKGHVETASGGTLFLDEIGELPASVQVKLLRFLQEKCFQRVGGRQEIQSDARVIAATNRNLQESAASGKFREDLYFRLAVMVVKMPALRERGNDIVLVAKAFLQNYGVEHAKPGLTFAPDGLRAIVRRAMAAQSNVFPGITAARASSAMSGETPTTLSTIFCTSLPLIGLMSSRACFASARNSLSRMVASKASRSACRRSAGTPGVVRIGRPIRTPALIN